MRTRLGRVRDIGINVRTTQEAKNGLLKLAEVMSKELGTDVTQAQTFEMLVKNALEARGISLSA